jgi:hypothetical protein
MRPKGKLFALVVLFAAVGLLTATGAFTTVEAERTADVNVSGDASALLQLEPGNTTFADANAGSSSAEFQIDLSGNGVNLNATTTVLPEEGAEGPLVNVTNNGNNNVEFNITSASASNAEVYFIVDNGSDAVTSSTTLDNQISGSALFTPSNYAVVGPSTIELSSGDSIEVGLVIVTQNGLGTNGDIFDGDVTFTADATST